MTLAAREPNEKSKFNTHSIVSTLLRRVQGPRNTKNFQLFLEIAKLESQLKDLQLKLKQTQNRREKVCDYIIMMYKHGRDIYQRDDNSEGNNGLSGAIFTRLKELKDLKDIGEKLDKEIYELDNDIKLVKSKISELKGRNVASQ